MKLETEKDREFRYQLGLQLAKRDVERFLATGTIEHKKNILPIQVKTAESKRNTLRQKENKQTAEEQTQ